MHHKVTHSHWFRTESQEVDSVLQDQPDAVGIAVWGQFEGDFLHFLDAQKPPITSPALPAGQQLRSDALERP